MVGTVSLANSTHHFTQAQAHQDLFEHSSWVTTMHQSHYTAFFDTTEVSSMPEMGINYSTWWSSFGSHIETHAGVHQSIGLHLKRVVSDFYTVDSTATTT